MKKSSFAVQLSAVVGAVALVSGSAAAQQAAQTAAPPAGATPPAAAESQLPAVEVVQETPVQKAARAKKAVAPIAPVVTSAPVQTAPGAAGAAAATSAEGFGTTSTSKVPNAVSTVTSEDFARSGDVQVTDVLARTVPGVILSDQQGNEFQRTLEYRGFNASPVNGVAQGLAVYQNGVRINESFGDIVNWDFLPSNAIDSISIVGSNPVFGLNAIGGAAVINMRDGFNFHGTEVDVRAGSNGRYQGALTTGLQSGSYAAFLALEGINDDGFRDFSESQIRRMYADLGVKRDGAEFHINFTGANNDVGVTAAAPVELLDLGRDRVFTSPQTTNNELAMLSVNGSVKATETLTFGGVAYYRHFKQKHDDGNIADGLECAGALTGTLCLEDNDAQVLRADGTSVPVIGGEVNGVDLEQLGSLDRTSQDADSFGGAVQAVDKSKLFGLNNQFLLGASYDHGRVTYRASSELGFFAGTDFVVTGFGPDYVLTGPDDVVARELLTTNDYVGFYFTDTLDVTDRLAVTVGGRYNFARVDLQDQTGNNPDLTGTHTFERFNPIGGATYKLVPGLLAYGSYAEANRAPTPAELACADPDNPCLIESFLTADPPLKQVVTKTYEAGLRGEIKSWGASQRLDWSLGFFRATSEDDILSVAVPQGGRGYFLNAGETRRQGIELSTQYQDTKLSGYLTYALTDATFETANEFSSPFNPNAVQCAGDPSTNCVNVVAGDRIPGIPRHLFKAGLDYWLTSKWKFGGDLTVASNQIFYGDEGNDSSRLGGYAKVDLHTSYDLTDHIQVYGLINNLFDSRYGVYGTYFDTEAGSNASGGTINFTDSRTITPASPFAAYGGVKVKF
ncbi:MAG: TonB-dependent receptor [Hyphomicrobium sp.]|jgi:outer membrane receptor protein involved in Fe transport